MDEINKVEIGKRIKAVRLKLGMNQTEFGERIGSSQASVGYYESGRHELPYETMLKVSRLGHVTLDWILTGVESTFERPISPNSSIASNARPANTAYIPIIDRVTGGMKNNFYDDIPTSGGIFAAVKPKDGLYALIVEGDSMTGGKKPVYEGDYAIIDTTIPPNSGDLVAIMLKDGRQLIKQLVINKDKSIELRSWNDLYPPIYVDEDQIDCYYKVIRTVPQGTSH